MNANVNEIQKLMDNLIPEEKKAIYKRTQNGINEKLLNILEKTKRPVRYS